MLPAHLRDLLKRVSRSFYLSVRVLPQAVQPQVAIGYLLARAADTIADTALLPAAERLQLLSSLRDSLLATNAERKPLLDRLRTASEQARPTTSANAGELALLAALEACLGCFDELAAEDQRLIQRVLSQLLTGMERDLERFPACDRAVPPSRVVALATKQDLDEYTYYAAGCVGEFWTDLMAAHLPALRHLREPELRDRGRSLGQALQMVNVIRDVATDLRNGRCYWPLQILSAHGLSAERLAELTAAAAIDPQDSERFDAVLKKLRDLAYNLCAIARPYLEAMPSSEVRLRLACAWPLLLAQSTLRELEGMRLPLSRPIKVTRRSVYELLLRSSAATLFDLGTGSHRLDRLLRTYP